MELSEITSMVSCLICVLAFVISIVEQNRKYQEMAGIMADKEKERGETQRRESAEDARHSAYLERDLQHMMTVLQETRDEVRNMNEKVDGMQKNISHLSARQDDIVHRVDHNQERVDDLEQVMRSEAILGMHSSRTN